MQHNQKSTVMFKFEKIEAWQKARAMNVKIYKATENFPKSEVFGITNQIRRASVSVCSNIAEGSGRIGAKNQASFTSIAYASMMEVVNQLILSNDLSYITLEELEHFRSEYSSLGKLLSKLYKAQLGGPGSIISKVTPIVSNPSP